jgi:ketosteroid isomerase-like protein
MSNGAHDWTHVRPVDVVAEFIRLRAGGDVTRAFTLAHDDVEFVLHLSQSAVPIGGVQRGKAGLVASLLQMGEMVDHLVWQPKSIVEVDGQVRVQLAFLYRSRASGQSIDGTCRMMFTLADGLITRIEEFHDRAKMEAFFQLFGPPPGDGGAQRDLAPPTPQDAD